MQTNKVKNVTPFVTLLLSILLFASGFVILFLDEKISLTILIYLTMFLLLYKGISTFTILCKEEKFKEAIIRLIIYVGLAIVISIFDDVFLKSIDIFVAVIAIALAVLRIFICIHLRITQSPGFFRNLVSAILCLSFAVIIFIFYNNISTDIVLIVTGVYLILYAITHFLDFIAELSESDLASDKLKRRFHYTLPNALTATKTQSLINKYNKILENDDTITRIVDEKEQTEYTDVNFEIMIHTSQILAKRFGHVDICIGDTVYSYGCYDGSSCKFGGMVAGGTFVVVPKEPYINNCLTNQRKFIIGYGCCLSDEQMKAVRDRIDEIFTKTKIMDIDPNAVDLREGGDGAETIVKMGGKVYKVLSGPFKTYFAISSNCVQLADTIIGKAGIDSLSKNSLKTPGAYYTMMENMFNRKNTRVIRRTAYLQTEAGAKKKLDELAEKKAQEKKAQKELEKRRKLEED